MVKVEAAVVIVEVEALLVACPSDVTEVEAILVACWSEVMLVKAVLVVCPSEVTEVKVGVVPVVCPMEVTEVTGVELLGRGHSVDALVGVSVAEAKPSGDRRELQAAAPCFFVCFSVRFFFRGGSGDAGL